MHGDEDGDKDGNKGVDKMAVQYDNSLVYQAAR